MMPKTLYVRRIPQEVHADRFDVREKLSDFENLTDAKVWEFQAVGPARLTINGKKAEGG